MLNKHTYPSTSFSGLTESVIKSESIFSSQSNGIWTIIPWTCGSLLSSSSCQQKTRIHYNIYAIIYSFRPKALFEQNKKMIKMFRVKNYEFQSNYFKLAEKQSYLRKKFILCYCPWQLNVFSIDADFVSSTNLHANVHIRVISSADLNNCQTWNQRWVLVLHFIN